MQLISQQMGSRSSPLPVLTTQIAMYLPKIGLSLASHSHINQKKPILLFTSKAALSRTGQVMDLLWELAISESSITLTVKLNSQQSVVGSNLSAFFKERKEEVSQFVCQINSLHMKSKEGVFYFMEKLSEIGLETKVYGIKFITTISKLLVYIKCKILQTQKIYLQELENIFFYYKIPGLSLHQLENDLQPSSIHFPLKRYHQKITNLRHMIQNKRQGNRNQSRQNIQKANKHIFDNFGFLYGGNYLHPQISQLILNEGNQRIQYEFNQEKNLLLNDLAKFQNQNFDPILTTIEIRQKTKETLIDSGGYSEIFSGIYSFVPQLSIHKNINSELEVKKILKTSFLVRKKGQEKHVPLALKNEFNFLFFIRNKVCPYLAKYYCNNTILPFSDGELYLQYYPSSLADCQPRETEKLKIIEDISMGLLFLGSEGILHRDLKELNIMVDRNKRGRIIDFGSVSGITGTNRYKPIDNKIRSTQGYFIPYEDLITKDPSISKKINKVAYYSHRNYDMFALGKILHNQFFLGQIVGESNFFRNNLCYLSQKCQELNPENRIGIEQATIFLRQLMMYLELRRQFWKFKLNNNCKVHKFGQYPGEINTMIKQKSLQQEKMPRSMKKNQGL